MPGSRLYSSYSCFVGILEQDRKFYVDYAKVEKVIPPSLPNSNEIFRTYFIPSTDMTL